MLRIADGPLIVGGSQIAEDLCRPHLPRAYQTKGDALDFVRSMWEMGGGGGGPKGLDRVWLQVRKSIYFVVFFKSGEGVDGHFV